MLVGRHEGDFVVGSNFSNFVLGFVDLTFKF